MPPPRLKRSNTASAVPASLGDGEIAINQADGLLYYHTAAGGVSVINVGSGSGGGTVADGNKGDITVSGSSWTINASAVTDAKIAAVAASKLTGTISDSRLSGNVVLTTDSRLSDSRTPTSHSHGSITNAGAIGTTANLPVITGASGVLTVGSFGSSSGSFCQGNDARLSDARVPTAHASSHASGGTDAITPTSIGAAESSHTHAASAITSGYVATARLGSGTAGETTFLRGDQTWSAFSDSRWDLFLPPAPTIGTATAGELQATVAWTAPTVLSQTPITDYAVQYSTNSGSTWTTFTHASSWAGQTTGVLSPLSSVPYVFRVAAITGIGQGAWSAVSNSVTPNGGGDPPGPYDCTAYGSGSDGGIFAYSPVRSWTGSNPTSYGHSDKIARGPATLVLGGFANSALNGTVTLTWNSSLWSSSSLPGWTGTKGDFNVSVTLSKRVSNSYTAGAEYSSAPSYYGISQPHGVNNGTTTSAWIITLSLPAPSYPQEPADWSDSAAVNAFYAAMDAYYQWQSSAHAEARIILPVVYDYRSSQGDMALSRDQRMLRLASERSSVIWSEGPRLSSSITGYEEPLLATSSDIADGQGAFLYAIKETTVVSGSAVYYWDQGADVSGARSATSGGGYGYDWGNGVSGVNTLFSASRYARLTLSNATCLNS